MLFLLILGMAAGAVIGTGTGAVIAHALNLDINATIVAMVGFGVVGYFAGLYTAGYLASYNSLDTRHDD